jgi:hypothetical protein
MNKIKIDRGWVWETTKEETQWKAYECKVCRRLFMYPSNLQTMRRHSTSEPWICAKSEGGKVMRKMKRADYIRSLSDEDLMLYIYHNSRYFSKGMKRLAEWLQEEIEVPE